MNNLHRHVAGRVRRYIEENPHCSAKAIGVDLKLPSSTTFKALWFLLDRGEIRRQRVSGIYAWTITDQPLCCPTCGQGITVENQVAAL